MTIRKPRRRRSTRPRCESLEGRTLMAYSALDPTFGTGGVAPVRGFVSELVAQPDGKAVVVGTTKVGDGPFDALLTVSRYDTNGSLDSTFGTGGRASVPIPAGYTISTASPAQAVALLPDGSIAVTATVGVPDTFPPASQGLVARLTPGGMLDATFGTGGEVVLPAATVTGVAAVAAQADGSLVLTGDSPIEPTPEAIQPEAVVIRLTATGTLDTTFNGTGVVVVPVPYGNQSPSSYLTINGLAVDKSGRIVLGGTFGIYASAVVRDYNGFVARLTSTGAADATFGSAGIVTGPSQINFLAVQDDGKVVTLGTNVIESYESRSPTPPVLRRLDAGGSVDPTFAANGPILVNQAGQYPYLTSMAIGPGGEITVVGQQAIASAPDQGNAATLVARFTADGRPDASFGLGGSAQLRFKSPASTLLTGGTPSYLTGVAATASGQLLAVGYVYVPGTMNADIVLARVLPVAVRTLVNDYDLDGKSDLAAYLPTAGLFAVRPSGGHDDVVTPFGTAGAGGSIPVAGDFDGDGATDTAIYLPATGLFAVAPSGGSPAYTVRFGTAGAGGSIPVAGDFDGDGETDIAVYLPASGQFAVMPSGGAPAYLAPFGSAGAGASIPLAGDYDGDGKTDIAVYLPATGQFAVEPSDGAPAYLFSFGSAGPGASIPVVGDFDDDGKTDFAVYLPATGQFAVKPSDGDPAYLLSFGSAGAGASIPVAGDYDGDGKTDFAVYLPAAGAFAVKPSGTTPAYLTPFGGPGAGATLPVAPTPAGLPSAGTVSASSFGTPGGAGGVYYFLSDENLAALVGKKKSTGS